MHLEYSPSLSVGRTSSTATICSSKVRKIRLAVPDLHNEATETFCIPHARFPRQSDIYFKTLFLSVPFGIDHRRFTAGIKLFHTGNVHTHLSPRLVGLQVVPLYTHCRKSSASFTRFLARRQSVVSATEFNFVLSMHMSIQLIIKKCQVFLLMFQFLGKKCHVRLQKIH